MKYLLFVYPCDETWDGDEMNSIIAEELSIITKQKLDIFLVKDTQSFTLIQVYPFRKCQILFIY